MRGEFDAFGVLHFTSCEAEDGGDCGRSYLLDGLMNGGERWCGRRGQDCVVESDDAELAWHSDAEPACRLEDSEGGDIACGEDGCWSGGVAQHGQPGFEAVLEGERAVQDLVESDPQSCLLHGGEVAVGSGDVARCAAWAADVGDVVVSEVDEMAGRFKPACPVCCSDAHCRCSGHVDGIYEDHWESDRTQCLFPPGRVFRCDLDDADPAGAGQPLGPLQRRLAVEGTDLPGDDGGMGGVGGCDRAGEQCKGVGIA